MDGCLQIQIKIWFNAYTFNRENLVYKYAKQL